MMTVGVYGFFTINSFSGFLVGFAVGALPVPLLLSGLPVRVPETPQLEDAAPGQRDLYQQTFIGESRRHRRTSVLKAELAIVGAFMFLILF